MLDHIPTTQLYGVRASLEFLDLTQMGGVIVVRNHAFHGLANLRTLVINSMPHLQKIEALGRGHTFEPVLMTFKKLGTNLVNAHGGCVGIINCFVPSYQARKSFFTSRLGYLQHPCYFGFSLKKSRFSHNYF